MKRPVLTAWFVVVLLALLLPASVGAARPTRFVIDSTFVSCDSPTDDGFVTFFAEVPVSGDAFADLAFWALPAEPFEEAPTLLTSEVAVSGGATGIDATFQLVEFDETVEPPFGDPAGTAVLDVTLSPAGDPFPIEERIRNGNRWERASGTVQPLAIEGSLTMPGADLTDLSLCSAAHQRISVFATNPSGFNVSFDERTIACGWEDEDSFVGLNGFADDFGGFFEYGASTASSNVFGGTEGTITATAVMFEGPLFDEDEIEVGVATAAATLTAQGTAISSVEVNGRDRVKSVIQAFSVDGQFDVEVGGVTTSYPMDDEHCTAEHRDVRIHEVRPAGPKARPYANEGPAQAAAVRLGRTVRLVTGAGALEPEATCVQEDGTEVPLGNTAWWKVVGTGRSMTVDSYGSTFDTVIGVYVRSGNSLVQVGCVDDVITDDSFRLQSAVTWSSVAGTTYLIQIGGYDGNAGHLQFVVR